MQSAITSEVMNWEKGTRMNIIVWTKKYCVTKRNRKGESIVGTLVDEGRLPQLGSRGL